MSGMVAEVLKRYAELERMALQSMGAIAPDDWNPQVTTDGEQVVNRAFWGRSFNDKELQERIRTIALLRDVVEAEQKNKLERGTGIEPAT